MVGSKLEVSETGGGPASKAAVDDFMSQVLGASGNTMSTPQAVIDNISGGYD
jgi:hypothetical protein